MFFGFYPSCTASFSVHSRVLARSDRLVLSSSAPARDDLVQHGLKLAAHASYVQSDRTGYTGHIDHSIFDAHIKFTKS